MKSPSGLFSDPTWSEDVLQRALALISILYMPQQIEIHLYLICYCASIIACILWMSHCITMYKPNPVMMTTNTIMAILKPRTALEPTREILRMKNQCETQRWWLCSSRTFHAPRLLSRRTRSNEVQPRVSRRREVTASLLQHEIFTKTSSDTPAGIQHTRGATGIPAIARATRLLSHAGRKERVPEGPRSAAPRVQLRGFPPARSCSACGRGHACARVCAEQRWNDAPWEVKSLVSERAEARFVPGVPRSRCFDCFSNTWR